MTRAPGVAEPHYRKRSLGQVTVTTEPAADPIHPRSLLTATLSRIADGFVALLGAAIIALGLATTGSSNLTTLAPREGSAGRRVLGSF